MRALMFIALAASVSDCAPRPDPVVQSYERESELLHAKVAAAQREFTERTLSRPVPRAFVGATVNAFGQGLFDGESARYRLEYTSAQGSSLAVCGSVNAKNRYGAYTGYRPFFVEFVSGRAIRAESVPFESPDLRVFAVCGEVARHDASTFKAKFSLVAGN